MAAIATVFGLFEAEQVAYGAAVKLATGAKRLDHERVVRDAVYSYLLDNPMKLTALVNSGFLGAEDRGAPMAASICR